MAKSEPQKQETKNEAKNVKTQDELLTFKEELAKKEAMLSDYTDHLKRLQAEFENYCKRTEKERKDVLAFASEKLIVKLLLIIDDFERALKQLEGVPAETRKGIEMIFKNLHKVLDDEHVEPINSVGQKFDPYKHEVMIQVESEQPEDTIVQELQKGYQMNGKVIRYARVTVSKGNAKSNSKSKEDCAGKSASSGGN